MHPPLRAPGRDSCRGMQIYRKKNIDVFVLNFEENASASVLSSGLYSDETNLKVDSGGKCKIILQPLLMLRNINFSTLANFCE